MAPSTVLVLGHSFVRRLKSDLKFQLDSRMSPSFKLDGTARVYMHGIGVARSLNCANMTLGL